MSSIVLKIPTESQSFRAALTDATLRDRVQEWVAAAVTLDDAVYIPLRTDWMPPRDRRTADGVEVLLAGRWPPEVDAETGPRVSAAIFGRVWDTLCNATPADEPEDIATCGLSGVNEEQTENEAPEDAPVVIHTRAFQTVLNNSGHSLFLPSIEGGESISAHNSGSPLREPLLLPLLDLLPIDLNPLSSDLFPLSPGPSQPRLRILLDLLPLQVGAESYSRGEQRL